MGICFSWFIPDRILDRDRWPPPEPVREWKYLDLYRRAAGIYDETDEEATDFDENFNIRVFNEDDDDRSSASLHAMKGSSSSSSDTDFLGSTNILDSNANVKITVLENKSASVVPSQLETRPKKPKKTKTKGGKNIAKKLIRKIAPKKPVKGILKKPK